MHNKAGRGAAGTEPGGGASAGRGPLDSPFLAVHPDWLNRLQPSSSLFGMGGSEPAAFTRVGSTAVVTIEGGLSQRGFWLWDGYDTIAERFASAIADPQTDSVVLSIDSPGGAVAGLFDGVRSMRGMKGATGKPVVAYANESAFSAGYALATVADEIMLPDTGQVGSIGVIAALMDMTKALDAQGVRVAVVASGTQKTDTHPAVPITDAAIGRLRDDVNALASIFFDEVAASRGKDAEEIKALQAGTFLGARAVKVGLADAVGNLSDAVARAQQMAAERRKSPMRGGKTNMAKANIAPAASEAVAEDAGTTIVTPEAAMPVSAHTAALDAQAAKFEAQVSALRSELSAAQKREQAAAAAIADREEKLAKLEADRIAAKVDALVGKKITPAAKEQWLAVAKSAESTFDALVAGLPDLVGLDAGRAMPPVGNGERSTDAQAQDRNRAKYLALVDEKVKAGMERNEALSAVLIENPNLVEEG